MSSHNVSPGNVSPAAYVVWILHLLTATGGEIYHFTFTLLCAAHAGDCCALSCHGDKSKQFKSVRHTSPTLPEL